MTQNETQLWNRLESFELDEKDAKLTFSTRLARENGWNKNYTLRVIEEYKKFLFMCCTSPTAVTPSDPVDQAWHLHLTYTKSYWTNLCKNTLNTEIHHNPTKGGENEQEKFNSFYTGMQELYKEKFGTAPPPDIWHDNHTRFTDINFQRVNISHYWMIKKPKLPKLTIPIAVISLSGLIIQASISSAFIWVFIVFMIIAAIAHFKNDNKNNRNGGSGCGTNCSTGSCSSHSSHSGCSSHGDSGCSSGCSGCSGCGGGCGD